jgi:hippurate hydrolase
MDAIDVTVHGRGGHGSAPHQAMDPIPAACEMVTALHAMVTRKFHVFDPVVVTVGSFHAGTVRNVIPDDATFYVTARSFSRESRQLLRDEMVRLVTNIAAAHGLSADVDFAGGYPVTVNDTGEAAFATGTAAGLFGADRAVTPPEPLAGSEDFSYVLNEVPGAFVLLGACPPGTDPQTAPSNHSATAMFTDDVLPDGTTLYAELALRRLAAAALAPE